MLRSGREFLSIPGPTTVPDEVLNAMHRPAVDIYSGDLLDVTTECLDGLRRVFRTAGRTYIYPANGHGAWEAALANVLAPGDRILVLESGRFAVGWGETAAALGAEVEVLPGDPRRAVDPAALASRLGADREGTIKAILVVQVDTASGVVNDIPRLRRAIDEAGHGALLMVDTIASLATMPFEMDAWGVDVAVAGSQKGLMMSPGLGFVAAGEKALAKHAQVGLRSRYWDWTLREGEEHYQKYCGTPPEHLLFGLRQSLRMLFEEGLDDVFRRHAILAEAVRRAVERWSAEGAMELNILSPAERSDSVTMIRFDERHPPAALLDYCRRTCGVVLGVALGEMKGKGMRIAHMGHVNAPMILGTLGAVETGLIALGIPHGKGGVQAAIEWLARSAPAEEARR
jgi:alanine-glyoxylate transaminase/serine-glyoxylate transaminase/serine-pyruvate transaminase